MSEAFLESTEDFLIGQRVRSTVLIYDKDPETDPTAVLVDPASVIAMVHEPAGTETSFTFGGLGSPVVKSATGTYYLERDTTSHGKWAFRWKTSGGYVTVFEHRFSVVDSAFVNP